MKNIVKAKDMLVRIAKTALWAFLGIVVVGTSTEFTISLSDTSIALGLTAALVAVQNLFISPESIWGRSTSTLIQVFVSTWAATGFNLSMAALSAAAAAAIGAAVNFVVKTSE